MLILSIGYYAVVGRLKKYIYITHVQMFMQCEVTTYFRRTVWHAERERE